MNGSSERSWGSKGGLERRRLQRKNRIRGGSGFFGGGGSRGPDERIELSTSCCCCGMMRDLGARVSSIWEGQRVSTTTRWNLTRTARFIYSPRIEGCNGPCFAGPDRPNFFWWALMAHICAAHVKGVPSSPVHFRRSPALPFLFLVSTLSHLASSSPTRLLHPTATPRLLPPPGPVASASAPPRPRPHFRRGAALPHLLGCRPRCGEIRLPERKADRSTSADGGAAQGGGCLRAGVVSSGRCLGGGDPGVASTPQRLLVAQHRHFAAGRSRRLRRSATLRRHPHHAPRTPPRRANIRVCSPAPLLSLLPPT